MNKRIYPFARNLGEVTDSSDNFLDPRQYRALDNDYYGKEAKLVKMTPEEYINRAGSDVGYKDEGVRSSVNRNRVEYYKERAMEGDMFPYPWLEYKSGKLKGHDGRHRAMMAKELGLEELDVVEIYD